MKIAMQIEGTKALMLHAFTDEAIASLGKKNKRISNKEPGSPEEVAKSHLYIHDGKEVFPTENVFACFREAGTKYKINQGKVSTAKFSYLSSAIEFPEKFVPIISESGWDIDERTGVNQTNKARVLIHRPIFADWKLEFDLFFDDEFIPVTLFKQIVETGGKLYGIGNYRVGKNGRFGAFKLNRFEVEELRD